MDNYCVAGQAESIELSSDTEEEIVERRRKKRRHRSRSRDRRHERHKRRRKRSRSRSHSRRRGKSRKEKRGRGRGSSNDESEGGRRGRHSSGGDSAGSSERFSRAHSTVASAQQSASKLKIIETIVQPKVNSMTEELRAKVRAMLDTS